MDFTKLKKQELVSYIEKMRYPITGLHRHKQALVIDILKYEPKKESKEIKFGEVLSKINNDKSNFVIISYWWGRGNTNKNSIRNRTYEKQIYDLAKSCNKVKCNYYLVEIPQFAEKGMYQQAIGYKPEFIKHAQDYFKNSTYTSSCSEKRKGKTVIYIDSDIIILKFPYLFESDNDIFFINYYKFNLECYNTSQVWVPGGIMGFSNTPIGRKILDMFIEEMKYKKHLAEDKILASLFTTNYLALYSRCCWIPETYMLLFDTHEYDTENMKYSKISTLSQELQDKDFKPSDIIIKHEDLETIELGDKLLKSRNISDNRFPFDFYKKMGSKLKCVYKPNTFINYVNYGYNSRQQKHLEFDNNYLKSICKIKLLPRVSDLNLTLKSKLFDSNLKNKNKFLIVSFITPETDKSTYDTFVDSYDIYDYVVYKIEKENINIPVFLYKMLKKYKRPIVYIDINYKIKKELDIFENKYEMDFMMFNLNNYKNCNDPRILKTLNSDVIYLSNNELVFNLLKVWIFTNTKTIYNKGLSHKSLEYIFNKGQLILKLRCNWLPVTYISSKTMKTKEAVIETKENRDFDEYKNIKKFQDLRKNIEQCNVKKPLDEGEPRREHYNISKQFNRVFKSTSILN